VRLPKAGARKVQLVLRRGALRQRGTVKVGERLAFKIEGRPVSGKTLRVTARTRAKK
jgi:hypothetical protein